MTEPHGDWQSVEPHRFLGECLRLDQKRLVGGAFRRGFAADNDHQRDGYWRNPVGLDMDHGRCRPVLRLPGCWRSTSPPITATSRNALFNRNDRSTHSTNSCSRMSAEKSDRGSLTGSSP